MTDFYSNFKNNYKELLFPKIITNKIPYPFIVVLTYIFIISFLGGVKSDHYFLAGIALFLGTWNHKTNSLLKLLFPFLLTAIAYDSMRFYVNDLRLDVHVKDLYLLEKNLFGLTYNGSLLTPNEFMNHFTNSFLDVITGVAYITFTIEYILLALILFLANEKNIAQKMAWAYLLVNIMGFITYHLYPAAPPWYIVKYGADQLLLNVPPDPAGAIRFDQFFNVDLFKNMYSMSANIFGAMPSLHVSYPFLGFLFMIKIKKWRFFQGFFAALMCFSAVYLYHHYILDILLGLTYAGITFFIISKYPVAMKRVVPKDAN